MHHSFKVTLDKDSKAGCHVATLPKHEVFVLGDETCLKFYDDEYRLVATTSILECVDHDTQDVHRALDKKG